MRYEIVQSFAGKINDVYYEGDVVVFNVAARFIQNIEDKKGIDIKDKDFTQFVIDCIQKIHRSDEPTDWGYFLCASSAFLTDLHTLIDVRFFTDFLDSENTELLNGNWDYILGGESA